MQLRAITKFRSHYFLFTVIFNAWSNNNICNIKDGKDEGIYL
ncbi:unnamed protein product [Brassica napus]|uniref:(rape) hypothetical protein n=1 Tax=Brassica napus TaxID=3708 RepID=A0A816KIK7_BRANA|nr:unnamed protein product [Brassica napus]